MHIEPPLDYRQTLDILGSWEGQDVLVISHSQAPGEAMSHTQVVLSGVLGSLGMVDNQIDIDTDSVAAYKVGTEPLCALYLSVGAEIPANGAFS